MPILSGILAGYAAALFAGIVDFSPIQKAAWFGLPTFTFPTWNFQAAILFSPVGIARSLSMSATFWPSAR